VTDGTKTYPDRSWVSMANSTDGGSRLNERQWRERYEELAAQVRASAPGARPVLVSSTVDVDDIYVMSPARLQLLQNRGAVQGGQAAELSQALGGLLSEGRDGELFSDWPEGWRWLAEVLGPPNRVQVGGTGAQAAWALDVLGAPTIMALVSRSAEQLSVLAPDILVCREGRMLRVHELSADTGATPIRNEILEFPGGSGLVGSSTDRAHRAILRFSPIALERDEDFMAMQGELGPKAGAAVLSGFNGLEVSDRASVEWAGRLLRVWRECGPGLRHVELGDSTRPSDLKAIVAGLRGLNSSLGLSLSEFLTLWGSSADVVTEALELARGLECPSIVVHADRWSLAVHRGNPATAVDRLMIGNLLASARAAAGAPRGDVTPVKYATYDEDVPESGRLDDGWRVDCVPTPFVPRPASTIGLGDTFTAGLLLAAALEGS
jgi:ADP-dependent phosphofructokinase/glucokinase